MRSLVRAAIVATALLLAAPAPALADGWMSFFYGKTLDGTTPADVAALEERKPSVYGFTFGNMRGGIFGFETEIAFSPDFFAESDDRFIGDNSVFTWMGNFMLGVPLGSPTGFSFRPFGTGGFGWIRQRIESPSEAFGFDANAFGYDIGGGAMLFFGRHFGIRADYRYYKSFSAFEIFDDIIGSDLVEEQHLDFTRVTGSVVLRF